MGWRLAAEQRATTATWIEMCDALVVGRGRGVTAKKSESKRQFHHLLSCQQQQQQQGEVYLISTQLKTLKTQEFV